MIFKPFAPYPYSLLSLALIAAAFLTAPFAASCKTFTAQEQAPQQQTEEQALRSLREMMRGGKLPPEAMVAQIETRFANTKTGALARLVRAEIRMEAKDFAGAAQILDSNVFRQRTAVADYALWLRGKALAQAGRHPEAQTVFEQLVKDFPNSLRAREARILWAQSAVAAGSPQIAPAILSDLTALNDAEALLLAAKSYEQSADQAKADAFYRRAYFYGAGTSAGREAETKLTARGASLAPQTAEEIRTRAERLAAAKSYGESLRAYDTLLLAFPSAADAEIHLKRVTAAANAKNSAAAQNAFNLIPLSAKEKEEGYYQLVLAYANARNWAQARRTIEEMRGRFASSPWTPRALVAAGVAARDAKNKADESYFLRSAVTNYPNAVEAAQAQFEMAWLAHEEKNFQLSSQMLVEHLARYADKDTTYRGRAGYWAARDSERAGKTADACALYEAVLYRYRANWYGYLAEQRLANLRAQNRCGAQNFAADSLVARAAANLKTVTVAPETAGERERERIGKADELAVVGLFQYGIEELGEAAKTASKSPQINLALARLYRLRGDNTSALLALARSYPDYSQMFPEEMGREEWNIFYPLTHWEQIRLWAKNRSLDVYQVAGLIRQESVFNPRAKSSASAYGLMQLLVPTARMMARKHGTQAVASGETLFQPALNIELGTAYMREQFDKFGRIEFVAVAYNAGPGRVPQWRAALPLEMDEFVEAIPFRETRGYVQGVIRNSAQYRRLYDENGAFKPNVGARPLRGEIDSKPREQFAREFPEIIVGDSAG